MVVPFLLFMIVSVDNNKLCADTTHRPTVATVVSAHDATVRIEVQAPSVARVWSVE